MGLAGPAQRAWALYDFANSVVITTTITAIFPIYFQKVVAGHLSQEVSAQWFGYSTSLALLAVAVVAPLLGPIADARARRKRYLLWFLAIGAAGAAGLGFVGAGDVAAALLCFGLVNIGAAGSFVFYDALLPHLAKGDDQDRLSTSGYALGYVSGAVVLALQLAWIQHPAAFGLPSGDDLTPSAATLPTRLALLSAAVWWVVFSIPLFRRVPEPPPDVASDAPIAAAGRSPRALLVAAIAQVRASWRHLRELPDAARMLVAFLVYNDGIVTIIRMATLFGALLAFETHVLIGAILLVQVVGIPCALLFGRLARAIGAKRAVLGGVAAYALISIAAVAVRTELHFVALAIAVGTVQGGTQALSRSLFASLVPARRSSEFFALFAVLEKFAGLLGPALFGLVVGLAPDPRYGLLAILPMFAIGGYLLFGVDVQRGRMRALAVDQASLSK